MELLDYTKPKIYVVCTKEYAAVYHSGKTHIFRLADLVEFFRDFGPDPNDLF